jgi:hypothetical protein
LRQTLEIRGPVQGPEKTRGISINEVTDRYFETMGIRLLAGRLFTSGDRAGSPRVGILNETAARAFFGAESPLGRTVNFPGQRVADDLEIVGVVADSRYKDLRTPDERMARLQDVADEVGAPRWSSIARRGVLRATFAAAF